MNEEDLHHKAYKVLSDLMLRLKKLEDRPPEEQIASLTEQIEDDKHQLDILVNTLSDGIKEDFSVFKEDLEHYLHVPEDTAAFRQVKDDAAILMGQFEP